MSRTNYREEEFGIIWTCKCIFFLQKLSFAIGMNDCIIKLQNLLLVSYSHDICKRNVDLIRFEDHDATCTSLFIVTF